MKKIIFKFVALCVVPATLVACGVKGRPEPPLRPPPETSTQVVPAETKPVTFATDKVPVAPASKTKPSKAKKKNGN